MKEIINIYNTEDINLIKVELGSMTISSNSLDSFPMLLNDQIHISIFSKKDSDENVYIINKDTIESILEFLNYINHMCNISDSITINQSTPNSSPLYIGYKHDVSSIYFGYTEYREYELEFFDITISDIIEIFNKMLININHMQDKIKKLEELDNNIRTNINSVDYVELIHDNSYLHKSFDKDLYKAFIIKPILKSGITIDNLNPFVYIFPVGAIQNDYLNYINYFRYNKQVDIKVIGYDRDKDLERYSKEMEELFKEKIKNT